MTGEAIAKTLQSGVGPDNKESKYMRGFTTSGGMEIRSTGRKRRKTTAAHGIISLKEGDSPVQPKERRKNARHKEEN